MGDQLKTENRRRKSDGDFDRVAPFYDLLVRLVYGNQLLKAEEVLHAEIRPGDRLLVIGGGSGRGLPALLKRNPREVVYIEASARMFHLAQKRVPDHPAMTWVLGTETSAQGLGIFDHVLTAFFLDVFPPNRLKEVMAVLNDCLSKEGKWLLADFSAHKGGGAWWKKPLIAAMFLFFRITVGLKSNILPEWEVVFREKGFQLKNLVPRLNGLVVSMVWQRAT